MSSTAMSSMAMPTASSAASSTAMSMLFTASHSTPLYSAQWTPKTNGAYAGTCIFLLALAILSRLLQAYRSRLELSWHDRATRRRYVVVAGETSEERSRRRTDEEIAEEDDAEKRRPQENVRDTEEGEGPSRSPSPADLRKGEAVLTSRGVEERVRVLRTRRGGLEGKPWRMSVDVPRAAVFTVQAGLGYLLMLAVMTLNAGYFLSVLAGLFVGELVIGRYAHMDDGHH